jgi:signal transduction histidine kinase
METLRRRPLAGEFARDRARRRRRAVPLSDFEVLRNERTIGTLRAIVAGLALLLIFQDPSQFSELTRSLLTAYAAFAVGLLIYVHRASSVSQSLTFALHAADVSLAATVTLLVDGSASPMLVVVLLPLLAGSARWSVVGVLASALAVNVVIVLEALLLGHPVSVLAARAIWIVPAALMIGYLADAERWRRRESIDLGTVLRTARFSGEFDQTIALVLGSLVRTFGAAAVLLVVTDGRTGRVFRWLKDAGEEGPLSARQSEVPSGWHQDYFFPLPGIVCRIVRRHLLFGSRGQHVQAVDERGNRVPVAKRAPVPQEFFRRHPCDAMVSISLTFEDAWTGRLYVIDPDRSLSSAHTARLASRIAEELRPATSGLYRVHHLRTRAQAMERNRIARELHDGVTQSLLGVEMLIAVLRRRLLKEAAGFDEPLHRIQEIVRENIVALREIIESGRAGDTVSGDLVTDLEELVDSFGRHSGIGARFIATGESVPLTAHVHREVARIVHEGLVNVRKHSGAHHVLVRSAISNESWTVSIEDDGHGFVFAGRKAQAELDDLHIGPRTICERAKSVGAMVQVESRPGSGSRVEIAIPLGSAS